MTDTLLSPELKINSHDPRCHHCFLQFSNDMHCWQKHINDSSWWLEREKQCTKLFQQYGYDLQNGMWYCLIACKRSGWKGITFASQMLANGFSRQQIPCWPPLGARDLRRQILKNYCQHILPLIYEMPVTSVNAATLSQLQNVAELLREHASVLQSPEQNSLRQLSLWIESQLNAIELQTIAPTSRPAFSYIATQPVHKTVLVTNKFWGSRLLWSVIGAGGGALILFIMMKLNDPNTLIATNRIWPGNKYFVGWQQELKEKSAIIPAYDNYEKLKQQIDGLEQRLLDAEQKRRPYLSISELKTSLYQMNTTLTNQSTSIENELYLLQKKHDGHKYIHEEEYTKIKRNLDAINSKYYFLLSGK